MRKTHPARLLCAEPLEGRWLLSAPAHPALLVQLPAGILATLDARYPGARVVGSEIDFEDGVREYDVTALFDGGTLEATFTPEGKILEADLLPARAADPPKPSSGAVPVAVDTLATPSVDSDGAEPVEVVGLVAQDADDSDAPLSPSLFSAVFAALEALFPGARVIEAGMDFNDGEAPEVGVRAEFNGGVVDVEFTPTGQLLESQVSLTPAELPPAAIAWVRRHFPGATIYDVQAVSAAGDITYEMTLAPPEGQPVEASLRLGAQMEGEPLGSGAPDIAPPHLELVGERSADRQPLTFAGGRLIVPSDAAETQSLVEPVVSAPPAPSDLLSHRDAPQPFVGRPDDPENSKDAAPERSSVVVDATLSGGSAVFASAFQTLFTLVSGAPRPATAGLLCILPTDFAAIDRHLSELLRQIESHAAGAAGRAASAAAPVGAIVALVAAAHLLVLDPAKRTKGPAALFSAGAACGGSTGTVTPWRG